MVIEADKILTLFHKTFTLKKVFRIETFVRNFVFTLRHKKHFLVNNFGCKILLNLSMLDIKMFARKCSLLSTLKSGYEISKYIFASRYASLFSQYSKPFESRFRYSVKRLAGYLD